MERRADSTRILSRIAGPYLLVMGVAVTLRNDEMGELIEGFASEPVLAFVTGAFTLLIGVSMVAFHQRWGAPAQVFLSLLAWIVALRGAVLLAAPDAAVGLARSIADDHSAVRVIGAVTALAGIWLCAIGYARKVFTF